LARKKKPPRAYRPLEASDRHFLTTPPHNLLQKVETDNYRQRFSDRLEQYRRKSMICKLSQKNRKVYILTSMEPPLVNG
jgi:hypothetical protein